MSQLHLCPTCFSHLSLAEWSPVPPNPPDMLVSYMSILFTFNSIRKACDTSWELLDRLLSSAFIDRSQRASSLNLPYVCVEVVRVRKRDDLCFFAQTRTGQRDDPGFVNEPFPGTRRRPSALQLQARMGSRVLHQGPPAQPRLSVQL